MSRTGRGIAALGLIGIALTGCAQPGQLGSPAPTAAPAPPPVAAEPVPLPEPTGPVLLGSGLVEDRVEVSTPGPAVFSVRTVVLAPGDTTGWHSHPGTETSIVTAGEVTLQVEDDCDPRRFAAGDAVFVPDAAVHVARNEGAEPAELVVTYLLAPGAEERSDERPACDE